MAKLTREDVLKLAGLARIDLDDAEIEEFAIACGAILNYAETLQAIDIAGLLPTSQVTGLTNVMREDVVKNYGYAPADLLKNVPHVEDDQIKVKRMIG